MHTHLPSSVLQFCSIKFSWCLVTNDNINLPEQYVLLTRVNISRNTLMIKIYTPASNFNYTEPECFFSGWLHNFLYVLLFCLLKCTAHAVRREFRKHKDIILIDICRRTPQSVRPECRGKRQRRALAERAPASVFYVASIWPVMMQARTKRTGEVCAEAETRSWTKITNRDE